MGLKYILSLLEMEKLEYF